MRAWLRCTGRGALKYNRMLMALQFLPAPHIPRAFKTLELRAMTDASRHLVAYISRQWVNGGSFEPRDWSVFRQDVRTNNELQGYHNRRNSKASSGVVSTDWFLTRSSTRIGNCEDAC
ncbi:hypothetical protein DPMN_052074 [Dreissena polymorpha]|uniref:Uncharacterized protein n=1 Tax=Dreissena polymorpha TaxID=45954 RepID=A0A9D4CL80_DREPO|nr:hypothetical protein DPMN_052074 [Dreissena polymorpha]